MLYPRAFSHIGLSVTNIREAVAFYRDVFGFYLLVEPVTVKEQEDKIVSRMLTAALGEGWGSVTIAHMSTSDKIGIELFEFEGAERRQEEQPYRKTGIFHFCIQDNDIEGLAKKIEARGGKKRMQVHSFHPDEKPFKMVYCEDPFGNVIEIYSHSYELTYSQMAYDYMSGQQST